MNTTQLDLILEQLEEAYEAGKPLAPEDVCRNCPEMLETVRSKWERLQRFNRDYEVADDHTIQESTADIQRKMDHF